jgi:hypothetical protein
MRKAGSQIGAGIEPARALLTYVTEKPDSLSRLMISSLVHPSLRYPMISGRRESHFLSSILGARCFAVGWGYRRVAMSDEQ